MAKSDDLILFLFDQQPHPLAREIRGWLDASPRFAHFTETYREKIRKKIRAYREPEGAADLRAELEVAYCLLADRRITLSYEPYASAKRRGPDFAATYRANLLFNIEVAHIRAESGLPRLEERILRILLDKLGQMQPGMSNLLVIETRAKLARVIDLDRLMQAVKTRVEGKDPSFYASTRFSSPAAFYREFLHLSGILLWATGSLWINKQARPALDPKVMRLVAALSPQT